MQRQPSSYSSLSTAKPWARMRSSSASSSVGFGDRVGREGAQRPGVADQLAQPLGGQVGQQHLAQVGGVGRVAAPDHQGDAQGPAGLHALDVDRLAAVQHGQVTGLAGVAHQPLQEGQGLVPEVDALHHQAAQLEDAQPQPVAGAGGVRSTKPAASRLTMKRWTVDLCSPSRPASSVTPKYRGPRPRRRSGSPPRAGSPRCGRAGARAGPSPADRRGGGGSLSVSCIVIVRLVMDATKAGSTTGRPEAARRWPTCRTRRLVM